MSLTNVLPFLLFRRSPHNIYADTIWHQIVGWLFLGHSYEEFFTNERDSFENVFNTSKLRNIFKGRATYSLAMKMLLFQLDHIIIPDSLVDSVSTMIVCEDSGGSDHHPIIAEIEMKTPVLV